MDGKLPGKNRGRLKPAGTLTKPEKTLSAQKLMSKSVLFKSKSLVQILYLVLQDVKPRTQGLLSLTDFTSRCTTDTFRTFGYSTSKILCTDFSRNIVGGGVRGIDHKSGVLRDVETETEGTRGGDIKC